MAEHAKCEQLARVSGILLLRRVKGPCRRVASDANTEDSAAGPFAILAMILFPVGEVSFQQFVALTG